MFSKRNFVSNVTLGFAGIILLCTLSVEAGLLDDSKALKISGGENHTLVVTANNWAWACGPNGGHEEYPIGTYYGVLGTGVSNPDFYEISLLRVHDGTMYTESDRLEDINDISAGWMHSLALDVNGFVYSWGWNSQGQLGNGFLTARTTPVKVKSGEQDPGNTTTYLQYIRCISAGRSGEHSLAADANGYAYAWGRNTEGQLGYGVTGSYKTTPVDVNDVNDVGPLEGIISVSAGERHSMGLEKDDPCDPNLILTGRVYTWGDNDFVLGGSGVLGAGYGVGDSDTPVYVLSGEQDPNNEDTLLEHIVGISAGWDHSIALEKDDPCDPNLILTGRVYTWGNNGLGYYYNGTNGTRADGGRLGNGSSTGAYDTPVLVHSGVQDPNDANAPLQHIIAVSAGESHSMALDTNGYVYTWGDNEYGQLGNGSTTDANTPVKVIAGWQNPDDPTDPNSFLSNIVSISAGYWHSLAIDATGVVWIWGKTAGGRLGLANMVYADPSVCATPHRIPVVYNDTQETFDFGIVKAVGNAESNDVLTASEGIYYEIVSFLSKSLTLRSMAGSLDVVGKTVIDGTYFDFHCVDLSSNTNSTLTGFTITNSISNDGVYVFGGADGSVVTNNVIRGNGRHGIFYDRVSSPGEIRNNWIYDNGESGIKIHNVSTPDANVMIVNNTIIDNGDYGIFCTEANDVNIVNCIIWDNGDDPNDDNLFAYDSGTFDVTYSCVQGDYAGTGGNIDSDPCFVDDVNDDYHLTWASPCVDWGDPNFAWDGNETDIDDNPRVMGARDPNDPNRLSVDMGADEDYPHCRADDYDDWVLLGRPDCWATVYQCEGDAAVDVHSRGYRVYTTDLVIFSASWKKKAGEAGFNPCADFDHAAHRKGYRVYTADLGILQTYWKQTDPNMPGACLKCPGVGESLLGGGAELTSSAAKETDTEQLLDWLAEIWLDPEVREGIGTEAWLRLYQSLKE